MSNFFYSYGLELTRSLEKRLGKGHRSNHTKKIHGFRLTVKRLRALIRLLDSLCVTQSHAFLFRPIKTVYSKTGKMRDLEVQLLIIKQFRAQFPDEARKLTNLFERKVIKAQVDLSKTFRKLSPNVITEIENYFENQLHSNLEVVPNDCVNFIDSKLLSIKSLIGTESNDDVLHSIRKQLKDVIYTIELLQRENPKFKKSFESSNIFNNVQEQLGKWNDLYNLQQRLKSLNLPSPKYPKTEWLVCIEKGKCKELIIENLKCVLSVDFSGERLKC